MVISGKMTKKPYLLETCNNQGGPSRSLDLRFGPEAASGLTLGQPGGSQMTKPLACLFQRLRGRSRLAPGLALPAQAGTWLGLLGPWEASRDPGRACRDPPKGLPGPWEASLDPWLGLLGPWEASLDPWLGLPGPGALGLWPRVAWQAARPVQALPGPPAEPPETRSL